MKSVADAIELQEQRAALVQDKLDGYTTFSDATDRRMWSKTKDMWTAYAKTTVELNQIAASGRHEAALTAFVETLTQSNALKAALDEWSDYNNSLAGHDVAASASTYSRAARRCSCSP